jgi:hypothetical protein
MAGRYHIVDRWSPEAGDDYADLCGYMLTLSGLDVMKTWKEYREPLERDHIDSVTPEL